MIITLAKVLIMGGLLLSSIGHVKAQQSRSEAFYDRNGSFAGSAITRGNSTSVYDKAGRFDGSAIRNSDGTTSFYDRSGHFTGSASNTTPRR
jgi:hypothetical protein